MLMFQLLAVSDTNTGQAHSSVCAHRQVVLHANCFEYFYSVDVGTVAVRAVV